jgi:hypothetical protein
LILIDDLPTPDNSEVKYVTFYEAVTYWSAPTIAQSVKAKSRFGSNILSLKVINRLINSVRNGPLEYTIGFQQIRGGAKGSIPWKRSTFWINWTLRWADGPMPDKQGLDKSYQQTLKYMDSWSYMGMMDTSVPLNEYYLPKTWSIKKKYDPCGLFRYPQGLKR